MRNSHEWYEAGREAMTAGRVTEAISALRRSARIDPHFKTLELLGECLLLVKKAKAAVIPLAAATALNRQSRAPALLAEALLALGDQNAAAQAAEESLRRSPGNRRAIAVLASVTKAGVRPN